MKFEIGITEVAHAYIVIEAGTKEAAVEKLRKWYETNEGFERINELLQESILDWEVTTVSETDEEAEV